MNEPSYLIILIERNYLAQLVNGLTQQKAILKEMLKKNQYDVKASAELPKVNHDLKEVTQTLLAYNNIINCRLQDVYGFEFQSIKVQPPPKQTLSDNQIPGNAEFHKPEGKSVHFSKEADDNQNQ